MHILNKNIFQYNDLYNKIISLTREKFFYTEISLKDELITRIYLVLFHLGFILELLKKAFFGLLILTLSFQTGNFGEIIRQAMTDAYLQVSVFVGFTLFIFIIS